MLKLCMLQMVIVGNTCIWLTLFNLFQSLILFHMNIDEENGFQGRSQGGQSGIYEKGNINLLEFYIQWG